MHGPHDCHWDTLPLSHTSFRMWKTDGIGRVCWDKGDDDDGPSRKLKIELGLALGPSGDLI